jgi:hypothetical protein
MRTVLPRLGAPGRRARRLALGGSALAALAVSAVVVWHAAYASFTVSTPAYPLSWSTGGLALKDDDAGTAVFTATGIEPGASGTRCIVVTSSGTVPAVVRLYAGARTTTNALTTALNLTVVAGSGGSGSSCTGFTPSATVYRNTFAAFPTTYGAGIGAWTTAGTATGESRTYQFTYSLPANAPTTAQGGSASVTFTWEAQTTGGPR